MMTDKQLAGMIDFHKRAERAYRQAGKIAHAEAAKAKRQELEREQAQRQAQSKGR